MVRKEGDNLLATERTSNGSFGAIELTHDSIQEEVTSKLLKDKITLNHDLDERF